MQNAKCDVERLMGLTDEGDHAFHWQGDYARPQKAPVLSVIGVLESTP